MNTTTDHPPCNAYTLTRSSNAAVCWLRDNLPPVGCPCSDYSPDHDANGERAERWRRRLLVDRPHDLESHLTGEIA